MTDIKKRQAYELYNSGLEYAEVAKRLQVNQSEVIRAVSELTYTCEGCRWRRDGLELCILPECLKGIKL